MKIKKKKKKTLRQIAQEELGEVRELTPAEKNEVMPVSYILEDGRMDFKGLLDKAVEILNDQASFNTKGSEISVAKLELNKARANNFLDAIYGVVEVKHQLEILAAQEFAFKRTDELELLNTYRRTATLQAKGGERIIRMVMKRMKKLRADLAQEDPEQYSSRGEYASERARITEQIALMKTILDSTVDSLQKQVATTSRLIQLERMSGNRPWSAARSKLNNLGTIKGLEDHEGDEDSVSGEGPREMTADELAQHTKKR